VNDAVKISRWNTELFPQSWNVWDSYGEALALYDNTEDAISAYEKSVELLPDNKSGMEMLKKLKSVKKNVIK
jgi:tetratricopeptide (TPR) repeat protein